MKRLVDESTDELTRSLLAAGIEHRPAPGNKAQVIVALGAGSAIGLFGTNAFAWLGTTAGKVTAAGVAVGVAGALFVVAPQLDRKAGPPAAVRASHALPAGQPTAADSLGSTADRRVARTTGSQAEAEPSLEPSDGSSGGPSAPEAVAGHVTAYEAASPAAADFDATPASASDKAATKKLASWRERRLAARRTSAASRARGARRASSESSEASQNEPRAAGTTVTVAAASPGLAADGIDLHGTEKPDLDLEVRLVDDIHGAARRHDREALGRFLERYRDTFPDGQLKKEVAEFAARLEQSDNSRAP